MKPPTREHARLREIREGAAPWRRWGPYLSERQWGTVREDYSPNGDAWNYFTHDQARSRAYRWGEDGVAGICDEDMRLCFALALWNGQDPILKERMFGLTNAEGNHGEDVKEYYFYLDSTPTHSYMKTLYKYPQAAFPYDDLVRTNASRGRLDFEYELLDTGVFDDDRYFDVFVEYAKAGPDDVLIRISVANRGAEPAALHVLPHLWFRNTWWDSDAPPPAQLGVAEAPEPVIHASHPTLGDYYLYCSEAAELLFTDNETNAQRLFGQPNPTPFVKDGINDYVVHGRREAVNPEQRGTKAAAQYALLVGPGETQELRLRLTVRAPNDLPRPLADFDATFAARLAEADEFYTALTPVGTSADAALVMRQGFAGMLWGKQTYIYDLNAWLQGRGPRSPGGTGRAGRNSQWFHMVNQEVISMPDKWEYPWFAAWDLAFHTLPFNLLDPDFAADQLNLMLRERYLHPNGQVPAYEWNFGDVNPPVHAWAALFNYRMAGELVGDRALHDLKHIFQKLLLNFTWWVNRKDGDGNGLFEGGFLGLDNIGVFDRSSPLPTGGYLEQADGTAWMALFCQNMLDIALVLAVHDPVYEEFAVKFFEHFVWIASNLDRIGDNRDEMWDEQDGFFYDVLRLPDGDAFRLKVRSMVGLLPLCAVTVYSEDVLAKLPKFAERVRRFAERYADLLVNINPPARRGVGGRRMLSVLTDEKLRRVLARMLDPDEFLSDHGIRSLSRYHQDHPFSFHVGDQEYRVGYLPAESDSGMFGGNSNWRGPVWMPVNVLLIRALLQLYSFYGDEFKVECPTGSGRWMTLFEVYQELSRRLVGIFTRDERGERPVYGSTTKFQIDPHWRDYVLFYEYFHGDNGAGIGASHQTGWTGIVAGLICMAGVLKPEALTEAGTRAVFDSLGTQAGTHAEAV